MAFRSKKHSSKVPVTDAYPAEKARGGEIILRARWQRVVFAAGLGAVVILVLVLGVVSR